MYCHELLPLLKPLWPLTHFDLYYSAFNHPFILFVIGFWWSNYNSTHCFQPRKQISHQFMISRVELASISDSINHLYCLGYKFRYMQKQQNFFIFFKISNYHFQANLYQEHFVRHENLKRFIFLFIYLALVNLCKKTFVNRIKNIENL